MEKFYSEDEDINFNWNIFTLYEALQRRSRYDSKLNLQGYYVQ